VRLLDGRDGLEAAHLGHEQVHQDHVRHQAVGGGNALAAVLGLADDVEVLQQLQESPEPTADDGVIVHQQDANRPLFVSHSLGPLNPGCLGRRLVTETRARSMHQSEDALELNHVAQPVRPEVAQHGPLREPRAELVDRGAGQQCLAAIGQRLEPRRPVQRQPEEPVAAKLDLAADHHDPDPDAPDLAPVRLRHEALDVDRRLDRLAGRVEAGVGTVTDALEDAAPVRRGALGHDLVVAGEGCAGHRTVLLRHPRAPLHVGEQEAQVLRGELGRHGHRIGARRPD
jgi:hypothetical protein